MLSAVSPRKMPLILQNIKKVIKVNLLFDIGLNLESSSFYFTSKFILQS